MDDISLPLRPLSMSQLPDMEQVLTELEGSILGRMRNSLPPTEMAAS